MSLPNERVDRAIANFARLMADIQSQTSLRGNDIGGAGFCFDLPDGCDEAGMVVGRTLDRHDPLGGGGDSIVAEMHRCCARMVGPAQKFDRHAGLCSNGVYCAERPSNGLEDWS